MFLPLSTQMMADVWVEIEFKLAELIRFTYRFIIARQMAVGQTSAKLENMQKKNFMQKEPV
jgi:hypothetical protein